MNLKTKIIRPVELVLDQSSDQIVPRDPGFAVINILRIGQNIEDNLLILLSRVIPRLFCHRCLEADKILGLSLDLRKDIVRDNIFTHVSIRVILWIKIRRIKSGQNQRVINQLFLDDLLIEDVLATILLLVLDDILEILEILH